MTDAELKEILRRAEAPEEKVALDKLPSDPEHVLDQALSRAVDPPPKL